MAEETAVTSEPRVLGRFTLEITEEGANEALGLLGPKIEFPLPPLSLGTRLLGTLNIEGNVRLSDYRLSFTGVEGNGAILITLEPHFHYASPRGNERNEKVTIPIHLSNIGLDLEAQGTQCVLVLRDIRTPLALPRPSLVREELWTVLSEQVKAIAERIRQQINAELRKRPVTLFDLADMGQFSLPGDKALQTELAFESLGVRDSRLQAVVKILAKDSGDD